MTNNEYSRDGAVLENQPVPEHRPGFWADLEVAFGDTVRDGAVLDETGLTETAADPETTEMPASSQPPVDELAARRDRRRIWPMAAAAAVLALVGIGFLATRNPVDPGLSTDLVAGTSEPGEVVPLDGPEDATGDGETANAEDAESDTAAPTSDAGSAGDDGESVTTDTGAAADPTPAAAPLPAFDSAPGSQGEPAYYAMDGGVPSGSTFLANSAAEYGATWWAISESDCADAQYGSTIRVVNGSLQFFVDRRTAAAATAQAARAELDAFTDQLPALGSGEQLPLSDARELELLNSRLIEAEAALEDADLDLDATRRPNQGLTQDAFEPNVTFSGDISYLTVSNGRASWLVSCGSQIELWVASVTASGQFEDARLVWFGPGQPQNALVLWTDEEVSLNVLGTDGTPFSVEYDTDSEIATRNGRPTRFQQESGVIEHRSTPVAVSADGNLSYWPGISDQGAGACAGSFGRADTLWLRRLTSDAIPVWEPALADSAPIGSVTAMAIEPEFSQVAFADLCADEVSRVFIAAQRADGQLSDLREIDLAPYVPGFADALYWIDSQTLRIETDNSQYGFDTVRFDFRLDDGRQNGIIVQLD